jgi:hypothetical protein
LARLQQIFFLREWSAFQKKRFCLGQTFQQQLRPAAERAPNDRFVKPRLTAWQVAKGFGKFARFLTSKAHKALPHQPIITAQQRHGQ